MPSLKFLSTRGSITSSKYFVTPSSNQINEGQSVTFSIKTSGIVNGTTLYWTNGGTCVAADVSGNINSGSFVVTNNQATVIITLLNDNTTEGTETFIFQIRINSTSGTIVARSSAVNIIDTSAFNPGPFEDATGLGHSITFDSSKVSQNLVEKPFTGVNSVFIAGGTLGIKVSNPNNSLLLNGDFTIELWAKRSGTLGSYNGLISCVPTSTTQANGIGISRDVVWIGLSSLNLSDEVTFYNNKLNPTNWTHYALTRSGSSCKFYENGQLRGQFTSNRTVGQTEWRVGQRYVSNNTNLSWAWLGYLTNVRMVKGTAVYSGNFTPPISPVTFSGLASAPAYPSTTNVNTSFPSTQCVLLMNF